MVGVVAAPIQWSANVFLLLGLIALNLLNRIRIAAALGVIAALAASSTWMVVDWRFLLGGSYFWLASHVVFACGTLVFCFASSSRSVVGPEAANSACAAKWKPDGLSRLHRRGFVERDSEPSLALRAGMPSSALRH